MTWQTVWEAYDVPRLWDAVQWEDDPLGWEQVCTVTRAADMLGGQTEGLRTRRALMARSLRGQAAELALSRLDGLIATASREAASMAVAARGLHGIMTALAGARTKIQPLVARWDGVTSDWIPEFWDEVAAELNDEARTAMLVAAAEVREHRTHLAVSQAQLEAVPATTAPPALPGFPPTTQAGEQLAGMPRAVAATAGEPVSMLPIPPGSPYAPDGGAYLLPGPGVGARGFIVPVSAGIWRVPHTVPPVILPVASPPATPTVDAMANFRQWFSRLATPWRVSAQRA